MTIIIPRDQEDFDASLARLMDADHPDKRISLVTDTPYTGFDVPMGLAVAAGFLPEQTEENTTPPAPAPLDSADPVDPETPADTPADAPSDTPGNTPADDGTKSEEPQVKAPKAADTPAAPDPVVDTVADSSADKTTGARGKGGAGKTTKSDAPAQGAERKGA